MHEIDQAWREFAELADHVGTEADALLVKARSIGNPSAIGKARAIRDGALDLWRAYKDAGGPADAPRRCASCGSTNVYEESPAEGWSCHGCGRSDSDET